MAGAMTWLCACADVVHTPDHVATIISREAAAKPSHLQNVAVVAIVDHFKLGTRPNDDALVANGNYRMDSLMPAILRRFPAQLSRADVRAEAVPYAPGHAEALSRAMTRCDYVIELAPHAVNQQKYVADPSLILNVRLLNHALQPIWVARLELRTDGLPDRGRGDIRQWSDAMADDLAALLMRQLADDGFVGRPRG